MTRGRGVQEFIFKWGRDGLGPRCLGAEVSRGRDGLGPKCPVTEYFSVLVFIYFIQINLQSST